MFLLQGDVLLRAYRPPQMKHLDSWAEYHQTVVPHSVRPSLISLAYDGLSGHLGITKTYKKLLVNLYLPGMKHEVKTYIQQCHTCQMAGKPNEIIPPAP